LNKRRKTKAVNESGNYSFRIKPISAELTEQNKNETWYHCFISFGSPYQLFLLHTIRTGWKNLACFWINYLDASNKSCLFILQLNIPFERDIIFDSIHLYLPLKILGKVPTKFSKETYPVLVRVDATYRQVWIKAEENIKWLPEKNPWIFHALLSSDEAAHEKRRGQRN